MKKYKVIRCPKCHNIFLTQAYKTAVCPYCGKHITMSKAYEQGNILKESYSWDDIHTFMQNINR